MTAYWACTDDKWAGPFATPQAAFGWVEEQFEIDMSDRRDEHCEEVAKEGYTPMGKDEGAIATEEAAMFADTYPDWPRIKGSLEEHSYRMPLED